MKRQLLQNYILKRKYISNVTKSIRKDILKVTNSRYIIVCENPQRAGWGFLFTYALVVIDKEHNQQ